MNKSIILIQCKDAIGLVALISGILTKHNLNITGMREFADNDSEIFFTRVEYGGTIPHGAALYEELRTLLPVKYCYY